MAEVFLASTIGAEGFSRKVAIKRVLPGFSDNPSFAGMFVAEAQISSRLVHPNIVSVLDFDRAADGGLFLVMELVEGKDLDGLVSSGPIPIPVMIFVITEVLRGLGYAHDLPTGEHMRGVVHRDVSPHNVLLSWEGAVKVSDFGIAKARSATDATASVFIKGKPAYMSPEQANGQSLDGRSDLFAVGVMMWEMLVGRRLFMGEDTRSTLAAVLFGQIPRPRSLRGDVPKDLERVVMKLLERDLPARYATAEEAISDLLDCANAPKNGREALSLLLAERFPQDARVRQSLVRQRSQASMTPTSPTAATIAGTPMGHGQTAPQLPAAATPSLSSVMQAQTATLQAPKKRGAGKIAAVVLVTGLSGAATFGIVSATRGPKSDGGQVAAGTPGSDAGATPAVAAPTIDAAPPPPDAAPPPIDAPIDAPVGAPIDAAPPPPVDAGVADAPKKGPSGQAPSAKKHGTLTVHAFPALTVYLDGKRLRDTPINQFAVPVGKHSLRLSNPATNKDERLQIEITEGKDLSIERM